MKLSIRSKLLIGFAIVVGLSLVIQAFAFGITRDYIASEIQRNHLEKAQDAAGEITELLTSIEQNANKIANVYSSKGSDHTELELLTQHIFSLNETISKVSILQPSGREQFRYEKSGKVSQDELSIEIHSDGFDTALSGQTAVSKVYFFEKLSSPYVDIFFPITQNEKTSYIVKMQISLERLWEVVAHTRIGEKGFAYVVDQDGILIAHPDDEFLIDHPNLTNRKIIPVLINNLGNTLTAQDYTYTNEKKESVLAQGTKVDGANWLVIFEQPVSEAYAFLNFIQSVFFFTLLGSLILLFLIALFISDNLTRPIRMLQKTTTLLTQGHLDTRIKLRTRDELEDLANSFNVMAASMQDAFMNLEQDKNLLSGERNKMAVAFSGIVDGVIVVDMDRNISVFNKAAEKLTGYTSEEVIGKPIGQMVRLYDKAIELIAPTYCPITTDDFEGNVFTGVSLKLTGKNGKASHVDLTVGKIKEASQTNVGCILVLHDLSQEKELEEMKLDFVSMAAHELRTPLTSIRGYLAVFMEECAIALSDEQKTFLERISIASEQLMALVENLLNITRIEKGALTLNVQSFEWEGLVRKVMKDLEGRAEQKKITVNFHPPLQALPLVKVDVFRISEVVTNLLANAINYTAPGGTVTITLAVKDKEVITNIQDTGEGIPTEALPHLFSKFFRVAGKLEQGSKGTGLGLYISKAIVDMHHGKIWVESTLGKGSTFSFSLPIE